MQNNLSEDDISVKFITPAIVKVGWDEATQIRSGVQASLALDELHPGALRVRDSAVDVIGVGVRVARFEAQFFNPSAMQAEGRRQAR